MQVNLRSFSFTIEHTDIFLYIITGLISEITRDILPIKKWQVGYYIH